MSKIVNTTDEAVRMAAAGCPDVKAALKTLFPDVFKSESLLTRGTRVVINGAAVGTHGLVLGVNTDEGVQAFYKARHRMGLGTDIEVNVVLDEDGQLWYADSGISFTKVSEKETVFA